MLFKELITKPDWECSSCGNKQTLSFNLLASISNPKTKTDTEYSLYIECLKCGNESDRIKVGFTMVFLDLIETTKF